MSGPSGIAHFVAGRHTQRGNQFAHAGTPPPVTHTAAPGRTRGATVPGNAQPRRTQTIESAPGTGINHWWRYQEESIPGGGHTMVNVGTGNLVVQGDDMIVPHKGVSLAFRRTYNSQSLHDVAGSDGSEPGMYGNGWSNTFDAHMVKSSPTIRSVYDVDGARYDYAMPANPSWTAGMILHPATPGNYDYLQYDGQCGWYWIKKTGTIYYFYVNLTDPGTNCPVGGLLGAYSGRLYGIFGRNNNTYLIFSYAWDNGDASLATGKVNEITVKAESGMTATLNFADVAGHRLLQSIVFPDGTTSVTYGYDTAGNLTSVSSPPNNAVGTRPQQTFGYQGVGTGSALYWIYSPRLNASSPFGSDGNFVAFLFAGTSAPTATLTEIAHWAFVNPTIADGSNSAVLQPGYSTGGTYFRYDYYATGGSTSTWRDTDGHATNWVVDSLGRPTQTQECTTTASQACTGTYLITDESWDAANNLVGEINPRGGETDFVYDVDGNLVAEANPAPAPGAFRPTSLYSYGPYDNLLAYCDPVAVHLMHSDWTAPPAAPLPAQGALCPVQSASATRYQWAYPWYMPFGELTSSITPGTATAANGYQRTYAYDAAPQGGLDYGLPTSVVGTVISQDDPTVPTRQPQQTFWYDANGNLVCYGTGNGQWLLGYDALGRLTSSADPDDASKGTGACRKTGAQPSWNTATTKSYFPDGSIASSQGPSQRSQSVATTYTYDIDGNEVSETTHHGMLAGGAGTQTVPGVTTKWYDGADRLVEVSLPYGNGDAFQTAWRTRYLYDLTGTTGAQGPGQLSIPANTIPFNAYGNLAITEEYLPPNSQSSTLSWTATKASAFDAVDRVTQQFAYAPGQTSAYATTFNFDGPGEAGLLSTRASALGEQAAYAYDYDNRLTSVQYSAPAPLPGTASEQYEYDADGRKVAENSGLFGRRTNAYDATGNLTSRTVPAYGALPPTTLTYDYYPDGLEADVNVSLPRLSQEKLLSWSYRADNLRNTTEINYPGMTPAKLVEYRTAAGRAQIESNGSVSKSWGYGADGQLNSVTIPATTFSNIVHDAEGSIADYDGYASIFAPNGTHIRNMLTVRGELLTETYAPDFISTPLSTPPTVDVFGSLNRTTGAAQNFDTRTKVLLSSWDDGQQNGASYSFDRVGRLNTSQDAWQYTNGNGWVLDRSGSYTKSYDAENRLVSEVASNYNTLAPCPGGTGGTGGSGSSGVPSYQWNVDAHPWLIDGMPLLWSDDVPLIQLNADGTVGTVFIDSRAVLKTQYAGDPLMVVDRDVAGGIASWHDSTGYGSLTTSSAFETNCSITGGWSMSSWGGSTNPAPGTSTRNILLPISLPRADGIWDGWNTIQGVRTYDGAVAAWTTPDAYKGEVHDPVSQQSYMWNRNSPYEYMDPTGFDTIKIWARDADHFQQSHTFIEVVTDASKGHPSTRKRYSFGPSDEAHPFGSTLVLKGQDYDRKYQAGTGAWGSTVLADCKGKCTSNNGGFDESALDRVAAEINKAAYTYSGITHNSNSATHTMCVGGGGGRKCALEPGFGLHGAPGWGETLTVPPAAGQKG